MSGVKIPAIFVIILFNMVTFGAANAAYYYVSPQGTGEQCSENSVCSLSYAQSKAIAGDTIYLEAGVYTQQIAPSKSGSAGKYITFQAKPGEPEWSVIISTSSYGAYLNNKNYIKFDGLYFRKTGNRWIEFDSSDHNVIQNCRFYSADAYSGIRVGNDDDFGNDGSNYNIIRYSIFDDAPVNDSGGYWDTECNNAWNNNTELPDDCDRETMPADLVRIDVGVGNKIENSQFGNSSHNAILVTPYNIDDSFTIIRNNTIQNKYHTGIGINSLTLIEGNLILESGLEKHLNPSGRDRFLTGTGIYTMSSGTITRKNIVRDGDGAYYMGAKGTTLDYASINERAYNNTFYNNWQQIKSFGSNQRAYHGNVLKNNIIFDDDHIIARDIPNLTIKEFAVVLNYTDSPYEDEVINEYNNNAWTPGADTAYFKNSSSIKREIMSLSGHYPDEWDSSNFTADPQFSDPQKGNFDLKVTSPMVDAGAWLTTIVDSTKSNVSSFVVEDAGYFFDGWTIPGEVSDRIKTQNGEVARIASVDYQAKRITLETPIDIVKGEGVSIYYLGNGPDLGAVEYNYLKPPILKIANK